jgi:hypothetical protein
MRNGFSILWNYGLWLALLGSVLWIALTDDPLAALWILGSVVVLALVGCILAAKLAPLLARGELKDTPAAPQSVHGRHVTLYGAYG